MNPTEGWQTLLEAQPSSITGDIKSTCCHFEWKIDDFCSLKSERICSEDFDFFKISWRMQMSWANPNVRTKNISITLQKMLCFTKNPNVYVKIGFKRPDGSIFGAVHKVLEMKGQTRFVPGATLFSITFSEWKDIELPNDNLTVVCILSFAKRPPRWNSNVLKDLEDLFESERDADVTIRVERKQFKAHRLILMARSAVFATMFQHDMAERRMGEVDIDDCNPDSFRDFLLYLYTGKSDQVTIFNARGLYNTADKYSVKELKAKCSEFMSLTLSIDSICDALVLATMHNDSILLKSATDFFVKNFKQILQSPNWFEFQSKNYNLVHELLVKAADYVKV